MLGRNVPQPRPPLHNHNYNAYRRAEYKPQNFPVVREIPITKLPGINPPVQRKDKKEYGKYVPEPFPEIRQGGFAHQPVNKDAFLAQSPWRPRQDELYNREVGRGQAFPKVTHQPKGLEHNPVPFYRRGLDNQEDQNRNVVPEIHRSCKVAINNRFRDFNLSKNEDFDQLKGDIFLKTMEPIDVTKLVKGNGKEVDGSEAVEDGGVYTLENRKAYLKLNDGKRHNCVLVKVYIVRQIDQIIEQSNVDICLNVFIDVDASITAIAYHFVSITGSSDMPGVFEIYGVEAYGEGAFKLDKLYSSRGKFLKEEFDKEKYFENCKAWIGRPILVLAMAELPDTYLPFLQNSIIRPSIIRCLAEGLPEESLKFLQFDLDRQREKEAYYNLIFVVCYICNSDLLSNSKVKAEFKKLGEEIKSDQNGRLAQAFEIVLEYFSSAIGGTDVHVFNKFILKDYHILRLFGLENMGYGRRFCSRLHHVLLEAFNLLKQKGTNTCRLPYNNNVYCPISWEKISRIDFEKSFDTATSPVLVNIYSEKKGVDTLVSRVLLKIDNVTTDYAKSIGAYYMNGLLGSTDLNCGGIGVHINNFKSVPLGFNFGVVEHIGDCISFEVLLLDKYYENFRNNTAWFNNFVASGVGACLYEDKLLIIDRHLNNVMVTISGFVYEIDFGRHGKRGEVDPHLRANNYIAEVVGALYGYESNQFQQFDSLYVEAHKLFTEEKMGPIHKWIGTLIGLSQWDFENLYLLDNRVRVKEPFLTQYRQQVAEAEAAKAKARENGEVEV